MTAFLLWPLAALELTPRILAHLHAAPVTRQPPQRNLLSRASDRLPYTRRTKTTKETTTS